MKNHRKLTRSSSRIISAIPGLISNSSAFDSVANGSTVDCDVIGNSGVFMVVEWRPAADDVDDGDILFRLFGVTDIDWVAFVFIVKSFAVAVSEVPRFVTKLVLKNATKWFSIIIFYKKNQSSLNWKCINCGTHTKCTRLHIKSHTFWLTNWKLVLCFSIFDLTLQNVANFRSSSHVRWMCIKQFVPFQWIWFEWRMLVEIITNSWAVCGMPVKSWWRSFRSSMLFQWRWIVASIFVPFTGQSFGWSWFFYRWRFSSMLGRWPWTI